MNHTKPTLTVVIIGILFSLLSGCNQVSRNPAGNNTTPSAIASPASPGTSTTPEASQANSPAASATNAPSPSPVDTVPVKVYHVDDQCENLVSETVQVASDRPIEAAIGKVLEGQGNSQFKLSGYRVSVDDNGVATVDLRLSPDSPRQLVSLSACEQMSLFSSLEETLMQNPEWQIKSVRFTEQGKEVVL
ncbi:GerMN domain-containing protein [Oscillatoria sp. FACHB-1407]|uniref:GerMN domain-containing protein n=1 Tax=Oscillatoria sp. FACHB-1407 TaxID=2692847 RepID=UPI0016892E18|nr:GerMN domain-containing protein [Oscillatoria sp. FACHB-1407]MBD2462623.1 GerMN domain-containing protein [Oscillatoria sp. FACHB-1407]